MIAPETIRHLAQLAVEAYDQPAYKDAKILKDAAGQLRGFSLLDDDALTIAFAGTKSVHDLIVDGKVWPKVIAWGKVPAGFWEEYETLQMALAGLFLGYSGKVRLCGHSLGGALSVYAAEYAARLGFEVELVTAGCPDPGDAHFKRHFEKLGINHVRIVHSNDIIPHVPFWGFCQLGKDVHLDDDGHQIGAVHGVWRRLVKTARIFWKWLTKGVFHDHPARSYYWSTFRWVERLILKGGKP